MEHSIIIAKMLALYMLIVAAAALVNRAHFLELMKTMVKNKAVLNLSGIIALMLGVILVVFHNVWAMNWSVVITLLAWWALIKGTLILFCPKLFDGYAKAIQKPMGYYIMISVTVLLGVYLAYYGFFAARSTSWF